MSYSQQEADLLRELNEVRQERDAALAHVNESGAPDDAFALVRGTMKHLMAQRDSALTRYAVAAQERDAALARVKELEADVLEARAKSWRERDALREKLEHEVNQGRAEGA